MRLKITIGIAALALGAALALVQPLRSRERQAILRTAAGLPSTTTGIMPARNLSLTSCPREGR